MTAARNPQPLRLLPVTNTDAGIVAANLRATFERGYRPFRAAEESIEGPVSIVGAGSSLADTYTDIVGDVIAINSAHDFLIGKGIVPKYTMIWDANPIMVDVIQRPHPGVHYLIASRCHPSVFEKFKDANVTVWHALGGEDVEKYLVERNLYEPMVAGGSSGVTRAMFLAGAMGYSRDMHLFGVGGGEHREGAPTHCMPRPAGVKKETMKIRVCGKWWHIEPWMAMQAADFKVLVPIMRSRGVNLIVHGTGFLPYTATFLDCKTPDIKVSLYEKARRYVHGVILLYLEILRSPQLLGGINGTRI